ncbi:MAG: CotH kinase family protein [Acidobacteria bacterium]|nr:CotH kinase family protein [Acidobacteriota bacterium]
MKRVLTGFVCALVAGVLAPTVPVRACAVDLLITEFMAQNNSGLADEDADYSDWIELYNPCLASVDLVGWYLTDDPADLTKWQLPSVVLQRGEFLLVWASGKNRFDPGRPLHTSFKLGAEGEYLALVRPDGATVAQSFSPLPQYPDVSYGLPQAAASLIASGDAARYHVPTEADEALGTSWTAPVFDDAAWDAGPTGIGFTSSGSAGFAVTCYKSTISVGDMSVAEAVIADPATQASVHSESAPVINYLNTGGSAHYGSDRPFPGTQIGVDANNFVVEARATILIPAAGAWTFGVNSDDGFSLELNREPYTFSMSYPSARGPADTLAVFDIPEPGAYTMRLVFFENGGGSELELFAAPGSFAAFSAAAFDLVGDTANGGLSLTDIGALVRTDVADVMRDVNASLWLRMPFDVADPAAWDMLTLRLHYEDGFAAFLNGTEVAARNTPAPLTWDAVATADRPEDDAALPERIDLTEHMGLLQPGTNTLAVHGLNDAAGDGDFLALPELSVVQETDPAQPPRYFPKATPGSSNDAGYTGVSGLPSFSRASCLFTAPFTLELAGSGPESVIRYTLDGSEPTETRGTVYSGPLAITTSTRIRARAFDDALAPSPVLTRMYVLLDASVSSFSSNLPLAVVHTFGSGIGQEFLVESLAGIVPTSGGRASPTGRPDYVGAAGIRIRGSSSTGFPKKQYFVEIWDEYRQDDEAAPLGLPPESDFILYGPYTDKTLMRDVLAYRWSNDIGRWAPRTRYVEAYLKTGTGAVTSADYVGVYALIEKIKQDPNRVNLVDLLPSDATEPNVSGGYIVKKDRLDPGDTGFGTSRGQRFAYVEPKEEEITQAQAAYLKSFYDAFETALYGGNFADPVAGYAAYIDPDAFIDHHIIVEMTKNIDGFRLSTFMFKDRAGRLNMGPVWDYNLTLGNANYLDGWLPQGWYHDLLGDGDYPYWRRLFQDPEFALRYADRWFGLRREIFRTEKLLGDIDHDATLLAEAQVRNFQRWPILGAYVWPNWYIGATYADEVRWMRDWLADRLEWMDAQFAGPPAFNHLPGSVPAGFGLTITSAAGTVYYTLDGSDPRLRGGAVSASAFAYGGPLAIESATTVRARSLNGGSWSALNEGTFEPVPLAYVNEVLPHNVTVGTDEQGEAEPWIELYSPLAETVSLAGFSLSDDPEVPGKWPLPGSTELCGRGRLLVWADGEPAEGPLHANFRLAAGAGTVFLHGPGGELADSLAYPALGNDVSFGREPDGSANLVQFLHPTPSLPNASATTPILLNEYNGVSPSNYLDDAGSDTYWGTVFGNGGDWFELVVVEDHLDLRGWNVVVEDDGALSAVLAFTQHELLGDLRSGTIITVSEDLATDASYDPGNGDWWINLQASPGADGAYISALGFSVSNNDTRITIRNAQDVTAFGPAGEGVFTGGGISSREVFKLEQDPGPAITAFSLYNDGTSSTFGSPNAWSGGGNVQDLGPLRSVVSTTCASAADCTDGNPCTDDSCPDGRCSNAPNTRACADGDPCTADDVCAARVCAGQPVPGCCISDCTCDDGLECTTDSCAYHACVHVNLAAGSACDDGDVCTIADGCSGALCVGAAKCDDLDVCTADSCSAEAVCSNVPNSSCGVAGTVRYYRDAAVPDPAYREPSAKAVADVPIDASSDGSSDATTSSAGTFMLADLYGSLTVAPLSKYVAPGTQERGAVTSYDAALIAREAVGAEPRLSANQRLAGDVTNNGAVSATDAGWVSRFSAAMDEHLPVAVATGSDWLFLRCDQYDGPAAHDCTVAEYRHEPITGQETDDFHAIFYGDVSGNWSAGSALLAPAADAETVAATRDRRLAEALRGQGGWPARSDSAAVLCGTWSGAPRPGSEVTLELAITNADGILGLDYILRFDPSVLGVLGVSAAGIAAGDATALRNERGSVTIAQYGPLPLRGSGPVLTVRLRVLRKFVGTAPLAITAVANEGQLPLATCAKLVGM